MASALIAPTAAAATSADFSVVDGSSLTVCLVSATPAFGYKHSTDDEEVYVEWKSQLNTYTIVGRLSNKNPAAKIAAVGTYRVRKGVSSQAYGVDRS